jgi:hypothetical protein
VICFQASQTSNTPHQVVFLLAENKPSELITSSPQQTGKINRNALFEPYCIPRFQLLIVSSFIVFPAAILLVFTTSPGLGKKLSTAIRQKHIS